MIEPAPGRSSTTNGCLSASDRCWARTREYTSAGPPAPNGTTILTGWVGYSCAETPHQGSSKAIKRTTATTLRMSGISASSQLSTEIHDKQVAGACSMRRFDISKALAPVYFADKLHASAS